jgi:CRISPR type III-B/RAMP module-associated protein Cmr5
MSRTIDQIRASRALQFINAQIKIPEGSETDKQKLNTHIHKSPVLILQCGLGQTLAFLLKEAAEGDNNSKPKAAAQILYEELQAWLCGDQEAGFPMRIYPADADSDLMKQLVNGSRQDYFRAQEESLQYFNWLKKFAAAKL